MSKKRLLRGASRAIATLALVVLAANGGVSTASADLTPVSDSIDRGFDLIIVSPSDAAELQRITGLDMPTSMPASDPDPSADTSWWNSETKLSEIDPATEIRPGVPIGNMFQPTCGCDSAKTSNSWTWPSIPIEAIVAELLKQVLALMAPMISLFSTSRLFG